jgi:hypothetical protein
MDLPRDDLYPSSRSDKDENMAMRSRNGITGRAVLAGAVIAGAVVAAGAPAAVAAPKKAPTCSSVLTQLHKSSRGLSSAQNGALIEATLPMIGRYCSSTGAVLKVVKTFSHSTSTSAAEAVGELKLAVCEAEPKAKICGWRSGPVRGR